MYVRSKNAPSDGRKALAAFERACQNESGEGCYKAGLVLAAFGKKEEALRRTQKACERDFAPACEIFKGGPDGSPKQ
jgi:TPR repeat protein